MPDVPILIAGNGDRLLTIAAQRAQIIGLTGGDPASEAGPVDDMGMPDLLITRRFLPELTDDELLRTPGVLSGSTADVAETIRGYRDTYIIVQQPHAEAFAKVIELLR